MTTALTLTSCVVALALWDVYRERKPRKCRCGGQDMDVCVLCRRIGPDRLPLRPRYVKPKVWRMEGEPTLAQRWDGTQVLVDWQAEWEKA